MNIFNNNLKNSANIAFADSELAGSGLDTGKMKMLFMLIAAFVVYGDITSPSRPVGHCATAVSAE